MTINNKRELEETLHNHFQQSRRIKRLKQRMDDQEAEKVPDDA